MQASAYIPIKNFWEYHVSNSEVVEFKINTTVLTECLNIFGTEEETSLKIIYKSQGSPLILMYDQKFWCLTNSSLYGYFYKFSD